MWIPPLMVTYLKITNSITSPIPTMMMEIHDDGYAVFNKVRCTNTRISVEVSRKDESTEQRINLRFVINSVTILSMSPDYIDVRVEGDLEDSINLNSLCEYSTCCSLERDVEAPENPYIIARTILRSSGYRIDDGWDLPSTNEACNFITYPNQTVMDAVKYLLSYGIGETGQASPAYLLHSLASDSGKIASMEQLFRQETIDSQPKTTRMPLSITSPIIQDSSFIMHGVTGDTPMRIGRCWRSKEIVQLQVL